MIDKLRQLPVSLFFLFAGTIITRMGAFVFPYLTIYLSEARGYGFETVGAILSVGSIGLLAGNFAGGVLTDKWSRKWTLILALLLNAAGFAGLAIHYEQGWFYALFLFVGYMGSGMFAPAANTVIADLSPPEIRPFAYTVNYVCNNLGMGLGPLIGGFLANISYSWIFIGDVASSLACAALIIYGLADLPLPAPAARPSRNLLPKSKQNLWWQYRGVMAFCLAYFFLISPLMGLEYAVPLLVKKEFGASLIFVGVIYSVNAVCILAFSFPIEKLIRNRNEFAMMILSGVIWTAGLTVLVVGFSVPALILCTAIWSIGEIIASILVPTFIAARVPASCKGRFMALNDIVRSLAGVICPVGLGFLWTWHSAGLVVFVIAMMPVVAIFCYLLLFWISHTGSSAAAAQLEPQQ